MHRVSNCDTNCAVGKLICTPTGYSKEINFLQCTTHTDSEHVVSRIYIPFTVCRLAPTRQCKMQPRTSNCREHSIFHSGAVRIQHDSNSRSSTYQNKYTHVLTQQRSRGTSCYRQSSKPVPADSSCKTCLPPPQKMSQRNSLCMWCLHWWTRICPLHNRCRTKHCRHPSVRKRFRRHTLSSGWGPWSQRTCQEDSSCK